MALKEEQHLDDRTAEIQARRLLGDKVSIGLNKLGIVQLVHKYMPSCNCQGRRNKLNEFHRRLLDSIARDKAND